MQACAEREEHYKPVAIIKVTPKKPIVVEDISESPPQPEDAGDECKEIPQLPQQEPITNDVDHMPTAVAAADIPDAPDMAMGGANNNTNHHHHHYSSNNSMDADVNSIFPPPDEDSSSQPGLMLPSVAPPAAAPPPPPQQEYNNSSDSDDGGPHDSGMPEPEHNEEPPAPPVRGW